MPLCNHILRRHLLRPRSYAKEAGKKAKNRSQEVPRFRAAAFAIFEAGKTDGKDKKVSQNGISQHPPGVKAGQIRIRQVGFPEYIYGRS